MANGDAKPAREAAKRRRSQVVRIGTREMESRGAPGGFWTDLYHRSMTVYWPIFFGSAALIFVALNVIFGLLYWLGKEPVANVSPDRFLKIG